MFRWLFLSESGLAASEHAIWKLSALRIILISACFLLTLIGLDGSMKAIATGSYQVLAAVVLLATLQGVGIYFSARNTRYGAAALIVAIYATGALIAFFVQGDEISRLGIVLVYATPIIARIFFGNRLAMALMGLNCLPFFYLLGNEPLPHGQSIDLTLKESLNYIQAIIFLSFNVCVPLAVFRVLHALDASATRHSGACAELETSHTQYREFFENAGGPILLCAEDGEVLQANQLATALIGAHDHTRLKGTLFDWLGHSGEKASEGNSAEHPPIEASKDRSFITSDGRIVYIQYVMKMSANHYIVTLRDATSLRLVKEALERSKEREWFLSKHDVLTGLPNRDALIRQLAETLRQLNTDRASALVLFRLNSIRFANERFGNATGDKLIQHFADELRGILPDGAFCARLRSIVFAVVLPPERHPNDVIRQVERLRKALPKEVESHEHKLLVQFSTGIALARPGDVSPENLIRRSEVALDSARRSNLESAALFDEADAAHFRRSIEIELGMITAMRNNELRLVYQPKVDAACNIVGLEALIRWDSEELGAISPAEFIPIAESSGQIHEITRFVIDEVCAFIRENIDCGLHCPPVAVNLSANDVIRHDLISLVSESSARHGIPSGMLDFEITETALAGDEALAIHHLLELKRSGSKIAIDDFGTGYSSLSKLSAIPVHAIKIDRSFVSRIGQSPRNDQIVKSIIALARMMDCTTIAEGVETEEQEGFLKSIGCETFQGYFYHRPLEVAQLKNVLTTSVQP